MSSAPYLKKHVGGVYYVHWTEDRVGKRVSTRSKDLGAAKGFLATWLTMEAAPAPARGTDLTVGELWKAYLSRHVEDNVASKATIGIVWKNLEVGFAHLTVGQINDEAVAAYVKKRVAGTIGRPSGSSTCRRELVQLIACINFCASKKARLIPPALFEGFTLPAESQPRDRWLRTPEIQALLLTAEKRRIADASGDAKRLSRAERFLWLALETAGRKTAILELTWDRVDFEAGVLHLALDGVAQTKKRRASVPISSALKPVLERAYRERREPKEGLPRYVLDHAGEIKKTVARIAGAAGIKGVSPHVFRHTAATQMARRGVPLWIIAKVLGNTLTVVERTYAKHCPDDLRAAVDTISGGMLEAAKEELPKAAE